MFTVVRYEDLQQQGAQSKNHRHQVAIPASDQLNRFTHGCKIGSDIECVGHQEQQHHADEDDGREGRLDVSCESLSRYATDVRAHLLDGSH